jgi:hypothetical protein
MMKRSLLNLLIMSLVILSFSGCSRNQVSVQNVYLNPYTPEWWKTQSSYLHINSYGLGEEISQIASRDAAKADAMLKMAQYVEEYVMDMMDKFVKEAGITDPAVLARTKEVAFTAANSRFSNLLVSNTETIIVSGKNGEVYKTFLQLMIPKFEINRNILEQVHNDFSLYDIMRVSPSFQNWEKLLMNR